GILHDHGDAGAANGTHLSFGLLENVDAVEPQPVGGDQARLADELEDGAAGHRLARAAFAHNAEALAPQREGNALHHLDAARMAGDADPVIFDLEQGSRHDLPSLLGSSASRRPSPRKQKPSETMMMAKPGMVATHHWSRMKVRPREIIAPHS